MASGSGHLMEAPVAFGQRALPRLCREMRHSEPGTRVQALAALCDLVHDPERALESIRHGCVQQLKTLLQDNESAVRTKSTEVLYHLASHNVGREVMLHCGILSPLSELLDEPVASCRKNVHLTLNRLAHFPAGAEAMVHEGLVPRLVKKVSEEDEDEEVCVLLLSSLRQCVRVEVLGALTCGSVAVLRERLAHRSPRIRAEAAGALLNISVVLEGKQSVCAEGVVPVLVSLLTDSDCSVQANAAGTIMNTAVISTGKSRCLSAGALGPLVQLVLSGERAVCVNALRALTALAEAPGAKEALLERLPALRSRTGAGEEEVVRRAAQNALQVITWSP